MSKLKITKLPPVVSRTLRQLNQYKLVLFVVIVAGVYAYVLLQINSLSSAQPTDEQISAQAAPIKAAHVDKTFVDQLQKLQDNSVSVQALFETARDNPFQE